MFFKHQLKCSPPRPLDVVALTQLSLEAKNPVYWFLDANYSQRNAIIRFLFTRLKEKPQEEEEEGVRFFDSSLHDLGSQNSSFSCGRSFL